MILQAPFRDRAGFGEFLDHVAPGGRGVEIGTDRGGFARQLLLSWKSCDAFWCVDPWITGYDEQDDPPNRRTQVQRDEDEAEARLALAEFPHCHIWKATSIEAASWHRDPCELDFVYLDGDHRADAVEADLIAWFPNLKVGGILAGHDFVVPASARITRNVQRQVRAFAAKMKLDVHLVVETFADQPWSWYMVKR